MLQACFFISTFDGFGNEILASTEDLDLTYAASAQVAVDFRQLQNREGEACPVVSADLNCPPQDVIFGSASTNSYEGEKTSFH